MTILLYYVNFYLWLYHPLFSIFNWYLPIQVNLASSDKQKDCSGIDFFKDFWVKPWKASEINFVDVDYRCSLDNRNYDRLTPISLEQDPHQFELRRCKFPGSKIFGAVGSLVRYKSEVEALDTVSRETQGWLTSYNIRHNYTSPWRLTEVLNGHSDLLASLNQYREKTSRTLSSIFDKSTVSIIHWLLKGRENY